MAEKKNNHLHLEIDFESFFNSSQDLLCIVDKSGHFLQLNAEWERFLGYSSKALAELTFLDLVHPEDRHTAELKLKELNSESNNSFENRFRSSDGTYRWIKWKFRLHRDLYYACALDMKHRKDVEKILREKEFFLRESQRIAQIGSYVYDFSTGLWTPSETLRKIFGIHTEEDHTIDDWLNLVHPDERDKMAEYFNEEVCRKRQPFNYIYRIIRPDDQQERWIHGLGEVSLGSNNNPVSMLGTVQDITDRKLAERELEQREQLLSAVFETSGDAIFVVDTQGRIKKVNNRACSLYGYTSDEFAEMHITDIYTEEALLGVTERLRELKKTGSVQFETLHRTHSGDIINVEAYTSWLEFQEVYVLFNRDITEKTKAFEQLQKNEDLIHRLSDNVADGMVYQLDVGVSGEIRRFTYLSSGVERFHAVSVDEAMDDPYRIYNQLYSEDAEVLAQLEIEAIAEMKTFRAESRIINPSGETTWSLFVSQPHRNEENHIIFDGIELDITAQKQAELDLIRSKEKYERLIEGLGDRYCVFSHTAEGVFLYVSKGFKNLFGVSPDEIIGKDWRVLNLTEESLEAGNRADEIILRDHIPQTVELTCKHADGATHIIEVNYGPVIENDIVVKMEGICIDITEKRNNEELLSRGRERLAEAQQIAHIGNWELNHTTGELIWSDEIYNIFEIEKEVFGATYEAFLNIIHPDDRDMVDNAYRNSVENRVPYDIDHRILLSDGRIKHVHERCRTAFDSDGSPLISTGTVQDITALKLAEDERNRLQAQLYQSQKMEAVGQLAGGVAHDFNNMLGVILGHTEELLSDITPESEHYESIQELKKAAERSADLTHQLLAFSRQETIVPQYLDLNTVIKGMLRMLKRLIGENISIHWCPTDKETSVFMDPGQIDQILANLCVNARDAIGAGGEVTIKTDVVLADIAHAQKHAGFVPGNYVLVSVSDTGKGMDDETKLKMFEPFFTTKEVGKGTGLGLSTIYGIVQQNGGVIEVDSRLNKGTSINVYIPCQVPSTDSCEIVQLPEEEIPLTGDETILLVEDERMLLSTLTKLLSRNGYRVIGTESPEEALELAEVHRNSIDLLVTDVIMPGLNGRELANSLNADNHNMKILYMSGYTSSVITDHGVLDEGVNFIQKPFSFDDLLSKVKQALTC